MLFFQNSFLKKFFVLYLVFFLIIGLGFFFLDKFSLLQINSLQTLFLLLGLFLLFSLSLYYFQIFRPLKVVLEQVQALLVGKPYKNIFTKRIDEIGVLAHFFNQVTKGFGQVSRDIKDKDRMMSELDIAAQLQRDILPLETPFISGLQIVAKNKPATELGGDSFNFVNTKDKTLIYVGDVTGHGVAAGLIMTMVHSLINVFAEFSNSAYEIVVNVNKYIKKHVKKSMFMTLVVLCWDNTKRKMTYVGAGHEHILLYHADSGECEAILSGGVALGMVPDNSKVVQEKSLEFNNGDTILLYSDGITEARNQGGELFGLDRLKQLLIEYAPQYSAEGVNYHIAKDVVSFMQSHLQDDDMTLIVVKRDDNFNQIVQNQDQSTNWKL